jgi:flagellar motor switch protein FliN/FliY
MDIRHESAQKWFFERLTSRIAVVFESMTGVRPEIRCAAAAAPEVPGLDWRQSFGGAPGAVWITAVEKDWTEAGSQILKAAGIDDADGPALKSTYIEVLGQALSGIAQDFSTRLGREVTCAEGSESPERPGGPQWARLTVQFEGKVAELVAGIEEPLLQALVPVDVPAEALSAPSNTFDLLLDVELPVSVSFGRAQVALKDVIKLTTGAIVELNRSISEPVEVIVNNCVIARGEVVVVEGNFGVRIREVINRQERLRTLN